MTELTKRETDVMRLICAVRPAQGVGEALIHAIKGSTHD